MTDEENKRQRHLAEMMTAQCNGKQVQYRERDGEWIPVPYMIYNIADSDKLRLQWRIKPEPREWWFCLRCKVTTPADRLAPHHAMACIESDAIKVREVLND